MLNVIVVKCRAPSLINSLMDRNKLSEKLKTEYCVLYCSSMFCSVRFAGWDFSYYGRGGGRACLCAHVFVIVFSNV